MSTGFCVAITMNGCATGWVDPSTVTVRSPITSRRADCVFGEARLISSATTTFAKTGPARNSKEFVRWSSTVVPVMSAGKRSGVN